jgi:hypothetical protein
MTIDNAADEAIAMTDAERTRQIKAGLRTAYPQIKFAVTRGGERIEWEDSGPSLEAVRQTLATLPFISIRENPYGDRQPTVQVDGHHSCLDRFNVARREADAAQMERWRQEERQRERQRRAERETPEALAKAAAEALARKQESIQQGVETRQWRRQSALWQAVKAWREGKLVAGYECRCCHKPLTDPPSILRSVGPECWGHILNHENRSLELLREKGVDRPAMLAEIARVRTDLTEHAVAIQDRHFAKLAEKRRWILEGDDEQLKANCLRMIFDEVDRTHRGRLAFLNQFEDELHGGLLRKGSLEQLQGMNLAALLEA